MGATILSRTVNSATDKIVSLQNAQFARPVTLPTGWTKIRVAIRFAFFRNGSSLTTLASAPAFYVGLCVGTTKLAFDVDCDGFVGYACMMPPQYTSSVYDWRVQTRTATNWLFAAPTNAGTPIVTSFAKKTSTTWARADFGSAAKLFFPVYQDAADQRYGMLFVDMAKGSPNWTANIFGTIGTNMPTPALTVEPTQADFLYNAELQNPSFTGHTLSAANNSLVAPTFVDSLNAVYVGWNRYIWCLEIADLAVVDMSVV